MLEERRRWGFGGGGFLLQLVGILLGCLVSAAVVLALIGMISLVIVQMQRADAPFAALKSFSDRQEAMIRPESDLASMRVEEMKVFAQAACVQGNHIKQMRMALRRQLLGVPKSVVDEVLRSALIEGVPVHNSVQNTTAGVESDGRAFSYLAFWSTEYNGDNSLVAPVYSSCVMVSGMELLIGEDIAEWETSEDEVIVGMQPCHCGYFRCAQCPITKNVRTRRPIFKRHRLSLKNQLDLHNWMVASATDQARMLVESRPKLGIGWWPMSSLSSSSSSPSLGDPTRPWKPPAQHVYYGESATPQVENQPKPQLHHEQSETHEDL